MARLTKTAIGLSGGGFGGYLFEIGALTALDDAFDQNFSTNDFDRYIGISAGSPAAALLANGVRPEEILQANLSGKRPYYFERRDVSVPAMGEGFKTFMHTAKQFLPVLKSFYQNRQEMSFIDLVNKAQNALPSGVYSLDPFARYLEATFTAKGLSNSFAGLDKELYIPAIDLETGQTVMFGDEQYSEAPISQAICASAAAPVYFCPIRIQDRDYIDGGVGGIPLFELPVWNEVEFMVIINPTVLLRPDPTGNDLWKPKMNGHAVRKRGFHSVGDQAKRINYNARFSQAFQLFREEHPDKELFIISPDPSMSRLLEGSFLSFRDRVHLLQSGYESVVRILEERFAEHHKLFSRNRIAISLPRLKERMGKRLEEFGTEPRSLPSYQDKASWVTG